MHQNSIALLPTSCTKRRCKVIHARTAYLIPHHPHFMLGSMYKSVESRHRHWKIVNRKGKSYEGANSVECSPLTSIVVLATRRPPAEIIHIIAQPHSIQLCITVSLLYPTLPFNSPAGKLGFHCARFTASSQRADSPSSWTRVSWTKWVCGLSIYC